MSAVPGGQVSSRSHMIRSGPYSIMVKAGIDIKTGWG
nr:MAG TPA: hypothetical protein [Caudoviricetes sp.]